MREYHLMKRNPEMTVTRPDASLGKKGPENTPKFPKCHRMVYTWGQQWRVTVQGARVSLSSTKTRERARPSAFFLCVTHCSTVQARQASTGASGMYSALQCDATQLRQPTALCRRPALTLRVAHYARQPLKGAREFKEPLSKLLTFKAPTCEFS